MEILLEKLSETPVRSVSDVLKSDMPTVGDIYRMYGDGVAASVIALEIESLVKFINVGKTMNAEQQLMTAKAIVVDYPTLTIADIKLFFQRLRKGEYGKMYDRIDGQIIIQSLGQYFSDRCDIVGEITENEHHRAKKTVYNQQYHPDVLSAIKKAMGEKAIGKPKPIAQKTEDIGQRWIRQFNNLHRKYGLDTGIRMIKIGDSVFDITSFMNRKALNYENINKNR